MKLMEPVLEQAHTISTDAHNVIVIRSRGRCVVVDVDEAMNAVSGNEKGPSVL